MKVTISKGPNFKEVEKKVYQYLHKIFREKGREMLKKEKS
jgi:hypothetical protein